MRLCYGKYGKHCQKIQLQGSVGYNGHEFGNMSRKENKQNEVIVTNKSQQRCRKCVKTIKHYY